MRELPARAAATICSALSERERGKSIPCNSAITITAPTAIAVSNLL